MHAATPTIPDLPPIPFALRDLVPRNPRERALLDEPAPRRELGPPRSTAELRNRLAELILRRDALERRHAENVARAAERERMLAKPVAPRKAPSTRPHEDKGAKVGASWMADHGVDWFEVAKADMEAMGPMPEREGPRIGRPRKAKPERVQGAGVAPDVAAALEKMRLAGDADAQPVYVEAAPSAAVQIPNDALPPPTVEVTAATAVGVPEVQSPDWSSVAARDVGRPCTAAPMATLRVCGRVCEPEQMELPLGGPMPRHKPAERPGIVSPLAPDAPVVDRWRAVLARAGVQSSPRGLAIATPSRAGPDVAEFAR